MMMAIADRKLILLVDDDADIRDTLAAILQAKGFTVVTATHGADALVALARGDLPRLIILDLNMPVMDGWTFLATLRRLKLPPIPIIALSASLNGAPPNVDAFCTKPIELEHLLSLIKDYARA
jgi:CheY-like chemotaxis protein